MLAPNCLSEAAIVIGKRDVNAVFWFFGKFFFNVFVTSKKYIFTSLKNLLPITYKKKLSGSVTERRSAFVTSKKYIFTSLGECSAGSYELFFLANVTCIHRSIPKTVKKFFLHVLGSKDQGVFLAKII